MTVHGSWTLDALVAAYEHHLHRTRGLRPASVQRYEFYVRRFVRTVLGDDPLDVARLDPSDVVGYFMATKGRFRPRTLGLIATSLRSFFRFLRSQGLSDGRLETAVPRIAQRRLSALPLGLRDEQLARLLASSPGPTASCAARDRAILRCLAGLGLRPCEVADLLLDDVDWRAGILRVRAHKTRRDAVLPLPRDVGRAIVAYIRTERPKTSERRLFIQHRKAAALPWPEVTS